MYQYISSLLLFLQVSCPGKLGNGTCLCHYTLYKLTAFVTCSIYNWIKSLESHCLFTLSTGQLTKSCKAQYLGWECSTYLQAVLLSFSININSHFSEFCIHFQYFTRVPHNNYYDVCTKFPPPPPPPPQFSVFLSNNSILVLWCVQILYTNYKYYKWNRHLSLKYPSELKYLSDFVLLACDSEVVCWIWINSTPKLAFGSKIVLAIARTIFELNTYFRVLFYPNSTYNLTITYTNTDKSVYLEALKLHWQYLELIKRRHIIVIWQ